MNKAIGLLAIVALVAVPAAAQKVSVDWDRDANFESFKSFAWVDGPPTPLEGNHPMVHSLIKNSIEYWMTSGGMVEDTENPDLNVTYHTGAKESYQFLHTAFGYSFPTGWGAYPYYGMGGSYTGSTMTTTYEEGTLVIDIWDTATKKAVFRGVASKTIPQDPNKALKLIDQMIEKIALKFRKMRAKEE
jgi:hypothetical protein